MSEPADLLTLEPLSLAAVRSLLEPQPAPCLSVYLPTHRNVPDNTVDLPAFRHMIEALEMALSVTHPRERIERLIQPLRTLAEDARFWRHTRDGLAVLAAAGRARVFLLQRPVQPLALVGGRFHTLPLMLIAAALERFHLLALTSRETRVFEGTAWHGTTGDTIGPLDPVPLVGRPGQPAGEYLARADVIDEETFQPHRVQRGMGIEGIIHGGTGSKAEDEDDDTEIFLRYVERIVREQVSRRAELPLVLVAAARLAAAFRRLSTNPHLLADHVAKDPHLMPPTELAAAVAPLLTAARDQRIARAVASFAQARDRGQSAGDLSDIARAAVAGRVATLLIEADRFEPGRFDRATGGIETDGEHADPSAPDGGPASRGPDLFAALAESVLEHRGDILALARNAMPTESGVAAIYRW